ncbi:MAG: hypothetical protein LBF85_05325 [Tannerella sp.]|jgi:hypothetical protein|nr:hypothetical protein [Tannerella sp.]
MDYAFRRTYGRELKSKLSQWHTVTMTLVICAVSLLFAYQYSGDYSTAADADATLLWRLISSLMTDSTLTGISGAVILTVTALMQQRANYHMTLIRHKTKLPFLLFFLLGSTNVGFLPVRPASVAMLFFIPALFELFKSQERMESPRAFNAAALFGFGSLIWVQLLWFIPVYWYGMYKFKLLGTRNLLAILLGVLTVYGFVLGLCVWQRDFTALTVSVHQLAAIDMSSPQDLMRNFQWMTATGIFLLLLAISLYIRFQGFASAPHTRRILSFLLFFAVYAFALLFLYSKLYFSDVLYFMYMPASLIFACYFSSKHGVAAFLLYYTFLVFMFLSALMQIWAL